MGLQIYLDTIWVNVRLGKGGLDPIPSGSYPPVHQISSLGQTLANLFLKVQIINISGFGGPRSLLQFPGSATSRKTATDSM